jgi:hypothetical protein
MTNSKLIFKATDIFGTVLAQEEFTVEYKEFFDFSNFIRKEHKAFIEQMREQFSNKEHVYTDYSVCDCKQDEVNISL